LGGVVRFTVTPLGGAKSDVAQLKRPVGEPGYSDPHLHHAGLAEHSTRHADPDSQGTRREIDHVVNEERDRRLTVSRTGEVQLAIGGRLGPSIRIERDDPHAKRVLQMFRILRRSAIAHLRRHERAGAACAWCER
jgi:hypothetical protein